MISDAFERVWAAHGARGGVGRRGKIVAACSLGFFFSRVKDKRADRRKGDGVGGDGVGTRLAYGTEPLKPARLGTECYSAHSGPGHILGVCEK